VAVAAIETPAQPSAGSALSPKRQRKASVGLIFVSPALLFLSAFMLYPVANLVWLSFRDYSPLRSAATPWVGVANYTDALTNPETYSSIWTTILFTFGAVVTQIGFGLISAVCLAAMTLHFGNRPAAVLNRFFAGFFILPFAAPAVVAAVVWKMLLDPQIGPVDTVIGAPVAWFSDYALLSVIVVDAWKTSPFVTFILYAAVMSIDHAQFEAAKLDGANAWKEFWYVTIPSILPILVVTTAFRTVDAFTKAFDIVFATTGGGPGDQTMVFPLFIWRAAFYSLHFGAASALAVIAIIISGVAGASLLFFLRSEQNR
jgi:ABC-type sugar transport system permease subunit